MTGSARMLCLTAVVAALGAGAACSPPTPRVEQAPAPMSAGPTLEPHRPRGEHPRDDGPRGEVTLAFAGDVHFQLQVADLLENPRGALGPVAATLQQADVAMVNLETAVTERGTPDPKELEVASNRYYFRTTPAAFDVLREAGVDVAAAANNHAGDYGPVGVTDTLAASRGSGVSVVGLGRDRREAFTPYRTSVRGTDLAFFSADASFREGTSPVWEAGPSSVGLAAAHEPRPQHLLAAVRAADRRDDVVVVYMHWGEEGSRCPTDQQRVTARVLADAGADVVVGSHAHVQQGSGWVGRTLVSYGLGNFVWYHDRQPDTGVLQVSVRDGRVTGQTWEPARIGPWGRPNPVRGAARAEAVETWERLRGCAGLASTPQQAPTARYPPRSWARWL